MSVVPCFIVLVCLVLGTLKAECAHLRCIDGTERALSLDDANLPPDMFIATSQHSLYPSTEFTDYRDIYGWCPSISDSSPSIIVSFVNGPVLVTSLLSGGLNRFRYVNNFTLEYAASPTDEFVFYNDPEYNTTKEFIVPVLDSLLSLEEPVLVDRLKFNVLGHFGSDRCWHVIIFGCFSSNAVTTVELPEASFTVTVIPSGSTGLELSSSIPSPSEMPPSRVVKDYQALSIVLPIALITIVLVAAIVVIGVFICLHSSKNMTHKSNRPTVSGEAPRDRSDTIKEVKNILYELQDEVDKGESTYETVGEMRQGGDDDMLMDNPLYNSVSLTEKSASSPEKVEPKTGLVQSEPANSAEQTAASMENEYKEIA